MASECGSQHAQFTVIIPAHNEGGGIAATLHRIYAEYQGRPAPHVIVVPNGCVDDTAARAADAAPPALIIDMRQSSKATAINEALRRTEVYPVLILDADAHMSEGGLDALAAALRLPGTMAASPAPKLDLSGCDCWVRAYYRVWANHSYLHVGVGGSGVYGLSIEGAASLGNLPTILADDTYVRRFFPLRQQKRIDRDSAGRSVYALVRAPRTLKHLVACESRWHSGNAQLNRLLPRSKEPRAKYIAKAHLRDRMGFALVKLLGRMRYYASRLRGQADLWHRDLSNR